MDESPKTNNPIPPLAIFGIALYLFCYVSVIEIIEEEATLAILTDMSNPGALPLALLRFF